MTDKTKRLAFGIIDASAISRDNLLMAHGMGIGFASRIKSLVRAGATPEQLTTECDEMISDMLRLAGVDPDA